MNKKFLAPLGVITLFLTITVLTGCTGNTSPSESNTTASNDQVEDAAPAVADASVKEFEMESFNSTVDGAYAPKFSLKEITVNKGDLVRIKVNTTSGKHDFKIDEFNVFAETPEDEVTVVEFTADKAGEFVYYCNKGKHRELGQWGTLIVLEEGESPEVAKVPVREIEMESFTEVIDGEYFPQFSKKELTVKKGEKIRLKINTTSGKHDLKIDEFNVYSETPTGEITIIEFTPDKIGEFVYWCTKPQHRELGHWGTLIVTE